MKIAPPDGSGNMICVNVSLCIFAYVHVYVCVYLFVCVQCVYIHAYCGTCVLWTPRDQQKCPDYQGVLFFQVILYDKVQFGTKAKCLDYAGVLVFKFHINRFHSIKR